MGTDRVCLGAIAGSFGVKGEVRVKSFCADPAAIGDYGALETEDGDRRFEIKISRPVKGGFAARLSGVGSKEAADALKGTRLYADRASLPEPEDDEYYHADLIGLAALDTGGAPLGKVKAVLNHGASDLLELHVPGARTTVMVPFTREVVPTVDISGGRLIVDPPDGLFDDD
ncbi:MAG: ribosome maturation factor RimM [Pseudomonadota bacterium]